MNAVDVMTRAVDFVDPTASVQSAATQMAELDVGALFVGSPEVVAGVLTDRDILLRVVVEGRSAADVRVHEVMSSEVVTCSADDAVEAVLATMRERQFRRMPVCDAAGKAIGVVTLSDVAKHVESPEGIAEALREMLEPHRKRAAPAAGEAADDAGSQDEPGPAAAAA